MRRRATSWTAWAWVLIALRNALWRLLRASSLEEGVVDTVMRGGDTDTNAAIAGTLLGAVHGRDAVPARRRVKCILACPTSHLCSRVLPHDSLSPLQGTGLQ